MIKKIKPLIFIFALFLSLQLVYATTSPPTVSFPKTVTIVDTQISVDVYIYNPNTTEQNYFLKSYTSPYVSEFSESTISVSSKTSKKVSLKINPLENVLESVYSASIEIQNSEHTKKSEFEIIQKANRKCPVDLQYLIIYVKESDNYKLELIFKNSTDKDKTINITNLKDINLAAPLGEVIAPKNSESSMVRVFKTDIKETKLEYTCNGIYGFVDIELPKKVKTSDKVKSAFTGLVGFVKGITLPSINLIAILDSIIFQIILLIILIILVLSFSTKYIKFLYKK
jgi:hypothetical protein